MSWPQFSRNNGDVYVEPDMSTNGDTLVYKRPVNPWPIAASVMLATFLEVLDTTIAAVSLDHIAGSLSATYDQATWVLTTYLVANAVVLPSSGWFGQRFGRKRFLLTCLLIFTAANLFCGLSVNLPMLLLMRVVQGAGGGALQPISQAILTETFPKEQQGRAMGLYGLGVVVAPIIGPVLGGWITDNYSWPWIFYIKVPIGLLAAWMINKYVQDPPWMTSRNAGLLDSIGLGFMSLWLGCQEILLDKGQEDDWFGSRFITSMFWMGLVGLIVFIIREMRADRPLVNLRVLRHRNFAFGSLLIGAVGALLYGMTTIVPIFLETLMGYPAFQSGIAMIPRGVGSFLAMPLVGKLTEKMDGRVLVAIGFVLFGWSTYSLSHVTLDISPWSLSWPLFVNGLSVGFLFVPLNVLSLGGLPFREINDATGIYNLLRNVGGSAGISAVSTLLARRAEVHQFMMVRHLHPANYLYQGRLDGLANLLQMRTADDPSRALQLASRLVYGGLIKQSTLWAFVDIFEWTMLFCGICILLAFLLKKVKAAGHIAVH
jgi:DHA2 family multidrug resistance protein